MATPPVGIGDVIAGKYIVERVIGEGGMGVVVAARHRELEQRVAIKFLLSEIAEMGMAAERFRREARSAARMRGVHVCRVLDVGTLENGVPYMVMEYLEGCDLASELEKRSRLPYQEAVGYVLQACEALAEAHAAGVIHRDLKPANLFLEACGDGSRRIKVLDFGVSKSLLDATPGLGALTKTANLVGSPLYMSPEQLDSAKDVDPRTDVWALGIVLYELIAGRTPFRGDSIPQLVTAVLHDAPGPLAQLQVVTPDGLEAVLHRTLQKARNDRYTSVAELARALMPFAPPHAAGVSGRVSRLLSEAEPAIEAGVRTETSAGPRDQEKLKRATPSGGTQTDRQSTPLSWTRATRRRKTRLGVALIALVVLLSLGGFVAYRASNGVAPAAAVVAKPGPVPAKEEAAVLPPVVSPPRAAPPTADIAEPQHEPVPTEPVEAPTPASALPPVEDAKAVAPQEVSKPAGVAPKHAVVEPVRAPRREPDVRSEPVRPVRNPTSSAVPVSDFGGRR